MKKITRRSLLAGAAASVVFVTGKAAAQTEPTKPYYIVIDPATNTILLENGADISVHPASLTKLMTLAMVFEAMADPSTNFNLETPVKIPEYIRSIPGSLAHYKRFVVGASYPAGLLLAAAGNKSEARSTIALALHLGDDSVYGWHGDNDAQRNAKFLEHTNARLRAIGLKDTDTRVLTGWKNRQHRTTTSDIAILVSYIQKNFPKSAELSLGQPFAKELEPYSRRPPVHSSGFLRSRPQNVLWAKTGWFIESGHSQALVYEKGGQQLIAVVVGAPNKVVRDRVTGRIIEEGYEKLNAASFSPQRAFEDVYFAPSPRGVSEPVTEENAGPAPKKSPPPKPRPALAETSRPLSSPAPTPRPVSVASATPEPPRFQPY